MEWSYPDGHAQPFRPYQHAIAKAALLQNTLVTLPTGFGKTLIAATVAHNFLNAFPQKRVVFMAPSRPLVAQQIAACCDAVGRRAQDDAILLTGETQPSSRAAIWRDSPQRLVFCTPQTFENDLRGGLADPTSVSCVVMDEAHHASSSGYAYAHIVRLLEEGGASYRLLGLSATAGTDLPQVQRVVRALRIERIEVRRETDCELEPYSHAREVRIVRAPPPARRGGATARSALMAYAEEAVGRLVSAGALARPRDLAHVGLAPLRAAHTEVARIDLRAAGLSCMLGSSRPAGGGASAGSLSRELSFIEATCRLADAVERATAAPELAAEATRALAAGVPREAVDLARALVGADEATAREWLRVAPKVALLRRILCGHFASHSDSRAIVFVSRRDTVAAICALLRASEQVRATPFVGQSRYAGDVADATEHSALERMDQQAQQRALAAFRGGAFNTLVATSVAEEGLDIGLVDLIVCFDPVSSPIRLVQRFGRTGRRRDGSCVLLLTAEQERGFKETKRTAERLADALDAGGGLDLWSTREGERSSTLRLPCSTPESMRCRFFDPSGEGETRDGPPHGVAPVGRVEGVRVHALGRRSATAVHEQLEESPSKRAAAEPAEPRRAPLDAGERWRRALNKLYPQAACSGAGALSTVAAADANRVDFGRPAKRDRVCGQSCRKTPAIDVSNRVSVASVASDSAVQVASLSRSLTQFRAPSAFRKAS